MGFKKALQIVPQLEILLPDHKHKFPKSSLKVNNILLESDIWRSETLSMGLPLVNGILSHACCTCFTSLSESPFFRPFLLNKWLLMIIYNKVNSNYRVILLQTSLRVIHPPTAEINGRNPTEINEDRQWIQKWLKAPQCYLVHFTMVPYTVGHREMQPCAKSLW